MGSDAQDLVQQLLWREINDADPTVASDVFRDVPAPPDIRLKLLTAAALLAASATPPRLIKNQIELAVRQLSDWESLEVWTWAQTAANHAKKPRESEFASGKAARWFTEEFIALEKEDLVTTADELVRVGIADLESPWRLLPDQTRLEPDREYVVKVIPSRAAGLPGDGEIHVGLYEYAGGITIVGEPAVATLASDGVRLVVRSQPSASPSAVATDAALFRVRTPPATGVYKLRCSVYFRNSTLQSRVLSIPVGSDSTVVTRIDYRLVTLFPDYLKCEPGPQLSLMMNSDVGGTHTLRYFGHHPIAIGSATFDANEIAQQISSVRSALRRTSWGDDGEWTSEKHYRYSHLNLGQLSNDLRTLAISGRRFYVYLAEKLRANRAMWSLEPLLRTPGGIELTIREDARLLLPISLAYDYPLDTNLAEYILCDTFVAALQNGTPLTRTRCFQGECRYFGRTHIICPSGFWGFRHRISVPVSRQSATGVPSIVPSDEPNIVIGTTTDPDLKARGRHLSAVTQLTARMDRIVAESRESLFRAFRECLPHLVYLFCHAGAENGVPYFHVGGDDEPIITGDNLYTEHIDWWATRPLVFINGCESVAVTPESALNLVTPFLNAGASGVIGTEVTAFEPLATEFAELFLAVFLEGQTAAESVRQSRLELLSHGNPLGLIYVSFAAPFASLVRLSVIRAA